MLEKGGQRFAADFCQIGSCCGSGGKRREFFKPVREFPAQVESRGPFVIVVARIFRFLNLFSGLCGNLLEVVNKIEIVAESGSDVDGTVQELGVESQGSQRESDIAKSSWCFLS